MNTSQAHLKHKLTSQKDKMWFYGDLRWLPGNLTATILSSKVQLQSTFTQA